MKRNSSKGNVGSPVRRSFKTTTPLCYRREGRTLVTGEVIPDLESGLLGERTHEMESESTSLRRNTNEKDIRDYEGNED